MSKVSAATAANTAAPKKRRKKAALDKKKAAAGWWFIMPFLVMFIILYLPIIIDSIRISFSEIHMNEDRAGYTMAFVGLKNYQDALFADKGFVPALMTGIKQLIFDIPAIVIFSLFMAVLLNQKMFGRAMFRAIFFIPVIIGTGVVEYLDRSNVMLTRMTDSSSSIDDGSGVQTAEQSLAAAANLDWLFGNMKVGGELVSYVVGIIADVYGIISRSGVQMLIFLAGLQSISPAIYESCQIDGAAAWETFWKITFPMISPMILVNAIYTVIDAFTRSTNNVMMYIDEVYHKSNQMPVSQAMSWIYFVVVIAIIGVVAGLISSYVFYQRRD